MKEIRIVTVKNGWIIYEQPDERLTDSVPLVYNDFGDMVKYLEDNIGYD